MSRLLESCRKEKVDEKYFFTDESGMPYDEEAKPYVRTEEDEKFMKCMMEKYSLSS